MILMTHRRLKPLLALGIAVGIVLSTATPARALSADSLRQEVSRLASQGRLDEALDQVDRNSASLPASWNAMFRGKLELEGDKSLKGYRGASTDSAPPQMRGEALYRQAQYQYAAGRYNLAVPLFREYLARYPAGAWSEGSAYWMAYSCIQVVKARPGRDAYLDSAQSYLRKLEFRGRNGYYWPLARAAQARILLMRGDTVGAQRAARDARSKPPAEEVPGMLLLSLQAENTSPSAGAWEDSLRWGYPGSPETKLLGGAEARAARPSSPPAPPPAQVAPPQDHAAAAKPPANVASGKFALQVGVFSQEANARRFVDELASKKITARIVPMAGRVGSLYRVLVGDFKTESSAAAEARRVLKPKGYEFRVVEP